jgi:hypothetical protein
MGFLDDLGDGIAGTFTFGQCDGGGCGGDHRGRGGNPIGMIANKAQGVDQRGGIIPGVDLAGMFTGGGPQPAVGQSLPLAALGLDPQTLQSMVKPGMLVIGGLLGLTLVMKLI